MMGVTLSAAGSLQWFVQQLCTELAKKKGVDPYEVLNEKRHTFLRAQKDCSICLTLQANELLTQTHSQEDVLSDLPTNTLAVTWPVP